MFCPVIRCVIALVSLLVHVYFFASVIGDSIVAIIIMILCTSYTDVTMLVIIIMLIRMRIIIFFVCATHSPEDLHYETIETCCFKVAGFKPRVQSDLAPNGCCG